MYITASLVAQEIQLQRDQHQLVENDPQLIRLYTHPTGRSNKLLPKHKGPYQVLGREQSTYITEDLVRGKQI